MKHTPSFGGDDDGKQALKSSRLEGARVRIWREIECQWCDMLLTYLPAQCCPCLFVIPGVMFEFMIC